jgi:UTP--glucose-1-phosphate uridylyltransferase
MKGVIIAAGYGTRFLPVTKTIPKEMLPLGTRPSIDFIIEEFARSGIRETIIVSSRRKKALEDYFDREVELEAVFRAEGAEAKLAAIAPSAMHVSFVRQSEMRGTGHALLQAKPLLNGEPCVVAYPDDIHLGDKPLSAQLIEEWERTGLSQMAGYREEGPVDRYGVFDLEPGSAIIKAIVEKPAPGTEPSKEVSLGRFLLAPEFFEHLEEGWRRHKGGEYYHIYALNRLMEKRLVAYKRLEGERLDTGDPAGFLDASLRLASRDPRLRAVFAECARRYLGASIPD